MPKRTGLSHAVAAVVVVVVGPVLSRLIELLVTTRDIELAIESLSSIVSSHPFVPLSTDYTITAVYLAVVGTLAFIWGYAYHIRRHSGM
ncbi:hypothetical protein [Haloplanus halophilus]|uniref:hypothetical protein n=1 Tax=Haloplanus halophilus TaxID=2949993 RepID=UPI00204151CB|nr:hypothetical protein [Haloplanus sp. GDY1]